MSGIPSTLKGAAAREIVEVMQGKRVRSTSRRHHQERSRGVMIDANVRKVDEVGLIRDVQGWRR